MPTRESAQEKKLFETFSGRAIRRGNEVYFDRDLAMQFLDLCDRDDFTVIGLEGFRITDTTTEPQMAWIADYSGRLGSGPSAVIRELNNAEARRFIRSAPEDLTFNFVVVGGNERAP